MDNLNLSNLRVDKKKKLIVDDQCKKRMKSSFKERKSELTLYHIDEENSCSSASFSLSNCKPPVKRNEKSMFGSQQDLGMHDGS